MSCLQGNEFPLPGGVQTQTGLPLYNIVITETDAWVETGSESLVRALPILI